jgi:hypothetical protein
MKISTGRDETNEKILSTFHITIYLKDNVFAKNL